MNALQEKFCKIADGYAWINVFHDGFQDGDNDAADGIVKWDGEWSEDGVIWGEGRLDENWLDNAHKLATNSQLPVRIMIATLDRQGTIKRQVVVIPKLAVVTRVFDDLKTMTRTVALD